MGQSIGTRIEVLGTLTCLGPRPHWRLGHHHRGEPDHRPRR